MSVRRYISLVLSPLSHAYIDAVILAVLWPFRAESIHLRTSAVPSRDPHPTALIDQVATSFADYLRLYKASWLKLQHTSPQLSSTKTEHSTPHGSFHSTTSNGRTRFPHGYFNCGHTLTTRTSGSNLCSTASRTIQNGFSTERMLRRLLPTYGANNSHYILRSCLYRLSVSVVRTR